MIKKLTNTHKIFALIGLLITATLVRAELPSQSWSAHILNQERLEEVARLKQDNDALRAENAELQVKVNTLLAAIQTIMDIKS